MKIEGNRPNFDPALTGPGEINQAAKGKPVDSVAPKSVDTVSVSPDAQLASAAINAANQSSDIRTDVVARARALLENGKLGNDPGRLADALIDRTLNQ